MNTNKNNTDVDNATHVDDTNNTNDDATDNDIDDANDDANSANIIKSILDNNITPLNI